jgi:zinc protease
MQMLRGDEIAVDAGVSYDPLERLAGMFMFAGTPNQGVSTLELEQAFKEQISRIQETPVSKSELDRVKAQVIANKVFEKDSMFSRAMQIGMLDSVGLDWRLLDHYVEKVNRVTPADIQRVAKAYFDDRQLTIATLFPMQQGEGS